MKLITYNGETKTVREWAEAQGINYYTLCDRLRRYPVEIALTKEKLGTAPKFECLRCGDLCKTGLCNKCE